MTERALDTHGPEIAAFIEVAGHSHDGVELQERHRRGRVVEIDLARFQLLHQGRRPTRRRLLRQSRFARGAETGLAGGLSWLSLQVGGVSEGGSYGAASVL